MKDSKGAFVYKKSLIIDPQVYLQGMLNLLQDSNQCVREELAITKESIANLSREFDAVILAAGAGIKHLWPSTDGSKLLNVSYSGGQDITVPNDHHITKAILRGDYIVPTRRNNIDVLLCGSTKEFITDFSEDEFPINLRKASEKLIPRLSAMYPSIVDSNMSEMKDLNRSGIRVVPQRTKIGRLPIVDRFPFVYNGWFITGLASRGLVHHAYIGRLLAEACFNDDDSSIPIELKLS